MAFSSLLATGLPSLLHRRRSRLLFHLDGSCVSAAEYVVVQSYKECCVRRCGVVCGSDTSVAGVLLGVLSLHMPELKVVLSHSVLMSTLLSRVPVNFSPVVSLSVAYFSVLLC